jgi:hypothetical protein
VRTGAEQPGHQVFGLAPDRRGRAYQQLATAFPSVTAARQEESEVDQAAFAWACLSRQGQRVTKNGKVIESAVENIAELTNMADQFATKRLPMLRAIEVVEQQTSTHFSS